MVAYSQQTIACLQPSIFLCSSAFDDLCDVDAVVPRDVLIANTSSNAEPQTYMQCEINYWPFNQRYQTINQLETVLRKSNARTTQ